jgi:hypothetical protein
VWQQARVMIGEASQRFEATQQRSFRLQARRLREIGEELIASLRLDKAVPKNTCTRN